MSIIALLVLLQIKHYIVDFPMQGPWMYQNKGTWLHSGGLAHAAIHGLATLIVVVFWSPWYALLIALAEAISHYLIDYAKVRMTKHFGWGETPSARQAPRRISRNHANTHHATVMGQHK